MHRLSRNMNFAGYCPNREKLHASRTYLISELFQQCLRLLEIGGVKALGEPAIDRREEFVGFGTPALLLPQPRQAHGGAELQGLGLLTVGDGVGLLEAGFRLVPIWDRLP